MTTVGARYQRMFDRLASRQEGAFVPFLVLGDPDPATSLALIRTLSEAGADALELGLAFSDPIADGPVIQAAATRALTAGSTLVQAWEIIATIRAENPDLPIGLLVYANLVMQDGPEAFYRAARAAGVDSVLVADAPLLEALPLNEAARAEGIAPVLIAPPNADDTRIGQIAQASAGYVYVVSRPGVTGSDDQLRADSRRLFDRLAAAGGPPALLGFGIGRPEQVREALSLGAAGAISGSAVVRHVAEHPTGGPDLLAAVGAFVRRMKDATRGKTAT